MSKGLRKIPDLLALDFDGVVCDGLREYFHTAWRVYNTVWGGAVSKTPTGLAESFYRMRPVIESGWEMPLLVRALMSGYSERDLAVHWVKISQEILQKDGLSAAVIGPQFNADRDEQIRTNEDGWLSLHRFYPGIKERIRSMLIGPTSLRIVTTKEERYARRLLEQQGIFLSEEAIIGRGAKQPKHQTLRRYRTEFGSQAEIWFVEDRLITLQSVRQHSDLHNIRLFLADWGYNTPEERLSTFEEQGIELLSLETFCDSFDAW
jgi:hypothetical protein